MKSLTLFDKNTMSVNIKYEVCTGIFCTQSQTLKMFNKESDWTLQDFNKNKIVDKIVELQNTNIYTKAYIEMAKELSKMPNFDNEIFKEFTGLDIEDIIKGVN